MTFFVGGVGESHALSLRAGVCVCDDPKRMIHVLHVAPGREEVVHLPPLARDCIESFARHRADNIVCVWTYGPLSEPVQGAVCRDASEILPYAMVEKVQQSLAGFKHGHHFGNGLAIFSDMFRLAVVHSLGGWWLDTDVFLLRPLPNVERVFTTEPRKLTGIYSRRPHNVHFPSQAPAGNFNLGVFRAPAGCPLIGSMLQRMRRKVERGRITNALYYLQPFVDAIRANDRALNAVLPPIYFCPLPVWTTKLGTTCFGYPIPTIREVQATSYGVHLLGPRLKAMWKDVFRAQLIGTGDDDGKDAASIRSLALAPPPPAALPPPPQHWR